MAPTATGQQLYARMAPLLRDMAEAVAEASAAAGSTSGTLRINTLGMAARQVIAPRLRRFHEAHPDVVLDIVVDDALSDIVAGRFDAGIRVGARLEKDMIAVRLTPDDFEVERTEHVVRSATVLMLDLSLSMPMRDNFLPAKKVAVALHALISSRFPRDYLGIVGFSEVARVLEPVDLPAVSWDFVYGTNMQHGLRLARQLLAGKPGTRQIVMITDGEPTAHVMDDGEVFFHYPPVYETVEATLREVARCTRDGIRINTFMLDATTALRDFIEKMARFNGGRAFFASSDTLGEYVLIDFLDGKRHERSRRSSRRAG